MITGYDLKEGVRYVRRDGTVTERLAIDTSGDDGFMICERGYLFSDTCSVGNFVYGAVDIETPHDLIAIAELQE